jgi:hypothetical protein
MSTANASPMRRRRFRFLFLSLGVFSGMAAVAVGYLYLPHYDPVRVEAWNKVEPRLQETDEATKKQIDRSTQEVRDFFWERKKYARSFAAEVLSLSGKWAYVKGFFQQGNHERYLEECFERNLFRSDELKALLESAVSRYVSEVQGRENQLLVAIRADLDGSELAAPKYLPALGSEAEFRREYDAMLQKVMPIVTKDLGISVTREVVSFVGAEIAATLVLELGTSLATELGISGGILGAGATSGAVTFGVGLVVGILVDMALDTVIRMAGYDPEGEIADKVIESLNHLQHLILEGEEKTQKRYANAKFYSTWSWSSADREASWAEAQAIDSGGGLGLSHQLNRINDARSCLRDETLKGLILKGSAQ